MKVNPETGEIIQGDGLGLDLDDPHLSISQASDRYLQLADQKKALETEMKYCRVVCQAALERLERKSVDTDFSTVSLVEPVDSIRYDTKRLESWLSDHPQIQQALAQFRKVVSRESYIRVSIRG